MRCVQAALSMLSSPRSASEMNSKQRKQNRRIVDGYGDACPRCGRKTQIREHVAITERELAKPFYYSRWFKCLNPHCKTTLIMPEKFRVWNEPQAETDTAKRLDAICEQLGELPWT